MPKLLFVIGTRPEIIKVAPVIIELKKRSFYDFQVINSGQHDQLIEPYWDIFDIQPDHNLKIINPNQSLSQLTARGLVEFDKILKGYKEDERPKVVLAQGDTTTVMIAAMVSFYNGIQFAHIEAGLRTGNLLHPFPEEYNRKVVSINAAYNFAPTTRSYNNLLNEGVQESTIYNVGNTVVDAVNFIKDQDVLGAVDFTDGEIKKVVESRRPLVLVTCHRRENHDHIVEIIEAITELAQKYPQYHFIWPLHANPKVKVPVENSTLSDLLNVNITNPLNYLELLAVMNNSIKIITDSGGIQEEAPTFNVPVIVLREHTERQEAVDAGLSFLVGSKKDKIIDAFDNFEINGEIDNPFGDGTSSLRIADILLSE